MEKLGLINTVLASTKQPIALRNDVRDHIAKTDSLKKLQEEFKEFSDNLS